MEEAEALAERIVIGAALLGPEWADEAAAIVRPVDFGAPRHGEVWAAIRSVRDRGDRCDLEPVLRELGDRIARVGGAPYLHSCMEAVPAVVQTGYYARRVAEHSHARRQRQQADRHQSILRNPDTEARAVELAALAAQMLAEVDLVPGAYAAADPTARRRDQVAAELEQQRIRRDAGRMLAAEGRPKVDKLEWLSLRDRLNRPRVETTWRIDGWMPTSARVVFAAQRKAGKTTTFGNFLRSIIDGDPWLGQYKVAPIDGVALLLDFEMSEHQLDDWLRDQRIANDDRLIVLPMRGKGGSFDILEPDVRAKWAARIRAVDGPGVQLVGLDCLRPVMDALGLDENRDAGRFLTAFDALLVEAGVPEAVVVHHMGHSGERSRGDSRIRDWPDVEWKLVRQDPDDDSSARFISAYGRDVEQREQLLAYDSRTRRLASVGGTRKEAGAATVVPYVVELLKGRPELDAVRKGWFETAAVETDGDEAPGRDQVRAAVRLAAQQGFLVETFGPRNSKLYRLSISAGR
jgi:hypothetical protein